MNNITFKRGNIFNSTATCLVNTVNCEGIMGRGIALEFKLRYPSMFKDYLRQLDSRELQIGKPSVFKMNNPWIMYFPTKDRWKDRSRFEYLEKGLLYFVNNIQCFNLTSIAFPLLGALNGGLDQNIVKEIMVKHLSKADGLEFIEIWEFSNDDTDMLMQKLKDVIKSEESMQFTSKMSGVKVNKLHIIKNIIDANKCMLISNLLDFEGVGLKTVEKLYSFCSNPVDNVQISLI